MSVLLLLVGIALLALLWWPERETKMSDHEWFLLMVGMCFGAFAFFIGEHFMDWKR